MTSLVGDISLREAALAAGFGYLVIFLFSFGNIRREKLIVRGDAAATARNIMASESRFRVGIATWMVILAADVVVAWALYVLLAPASEGLSLLTAWVRLVYVAVAAVAMVNLLSVLDILSSTDDVEAFEPDQINAHAVTIVEPLGDLEPGDEIAVPMLFHASGADAVPVENTQVELDFAAGEVRLSGEISHFSDIASIAAKLFSVTLVQNFAQDETRPIGGTVKPEITVATSRGYPVRVNQFGGTGLFRFWKYFMVFPATLDGIWWGNNTALGPLQVSDKPKGMSLYDIVTTKYTGAQTFVCERVGAGWVSYTAVLSGTIKIETWTGNSRDTDSDRTVPFTTTIKVDSDTLRCVALAATSTVDPTSTVAPTSTVEPTSTVDPTATPTPTATPEVSRAPTASPIDASLAAPTTTYTVLANDPDGDPLTFTWSGTNCGLARPLANVLFWDHGNEHGCAHEGADHRDATINVVVSDGLWEVTCTFVGSADGTGQTYSAPRALF